MEKIETDNFIEAEIKKDMLKYGLDHVVTRFPPEPNGYMHIGHLKGVAINFAMSEKFGGYTNLRFDDTNPKKEDVEYVNGWQEDISWIGYKWQNLVFASDTYEKMYDCATTLIKKGLAYVDDLTPEQINEYRGTFTEPGKESPYRNRAIDENLRLFKEMREDKYADGEKCLRAKIDMSSPNMNMRDPVIYRIDHTAHYRQGTKWCIYPLYDFAHPLEDAFENITHSLCSDDFEDHRPLYEWVVNNCDLPNKVKPRQIEFVRTNITNTITGKRYLRKLVEMGKATGWDDPRFPTVRGLRKRGYTPSSLRDFISRIGVAGAVVDSSLLEYCIRTELNNTATRVMTVLDPIKVVITNYEGSEQVEIENNPNDENAGTHTTTFGNELYIEREDFMEDAPNKYFRLKPDGVVRLKGAYIIKCDRVVKDKDGNIDHLECTYYPESRSGNDTSGIKVKGTIHWVNAKTALDVTVNQFGTLFRPDVKFEKDNLEEAFNPDSWQVLNAKAEEYLGTCMQGSRFQFIRKGYYYLVNKDGKLEFNQTVSLKDSFNK
ncbi:MAG: glutamine--tRNA ligase/YqeY domain fusion protein [Clostridia bacterium]|nr:glutamine--tRNA ligase/YqeY domain fusion protein [Clostridia bacterium]